jgi:hypothetical protein
VKTINLYVTDWAPNGTNDLLVCDENYYIIECIDEVTFGIDVTKSDVDEAQLCADSEQVLCIDDMELVPDNGSDITLVKRIDLGTLHMKLCISPMDPDGSDLKARLLKSGIDLFKGGIKC